MALRRGHGNGKGVPRIETRPADELPRGKQVELTPNQLSALRRQLSRDLARLDGIVDPPEHYKPYLDLARRWRDAHALDLAAQVGGGVVGPGPLAILSSATLQLASSRYLMDKGIKDGDPAVMALANRISDQHRQNMLACHELVAREALARAEANVAPKKTIEQLMLEPAE